MVPPNALLLAILSAMVEGKLMSDTYVIYAMAQTNNSKVGPEM